MPTIYNKIELDGTTLLDLSQDTASSASHIRQGYTAHLNDGTQVTGTYSGSTPTIQSLTVNPSTTQQIFNASGVDGYKPVTVNAMPSGTEGTPTATKGTVSNHQVSVTPSVTNTTGYITGSTKTGTAVTVTASELVSGSQTITSNGTYDVTNLASIVAAVQAGADIPIFTVNLTASPATATCNKSYAECVSAYNNNYEAWGIADVTTQNGLLHMAVSAVDYQLNAYMQFTVYNERGVPSIDLMYYPNESVTVVNPSALLVEADTPIATKGTVSNHSVSVTPSVTNTTGYIIGGPKTGTAVTVSASELVSGTYSVSASGTHDVTNYASASVPSGSATASATKGTVSNHSVTVTPSVTRTAGYITAGSANGTAVTVSASELVSGSETKTANGTYDVTNLASLVVNVSGGGGSSMQTDMVEGIAPSASSVTFTGLKGEPTSFYINIDASVAVGTPSKVVAIVFDGTSLHGQIVTNTNNAQASYSTDFTKSYSNGTLTVTSTGGTFITSESYFVTYTYGGGIVDTADVQVGSGATSITFTGLEDEPVLWSCIFKSNFSTSSGYQRVMAIGELSNGNVVGYAMGSQANISTSYWTASYNNGSFTITSQGTNQGGYFHQPGYYQLTYAYDDGSSGNYQSKTVYATSSQQVVRADSGYDALKQITIPAVTTTNLSASNIVRGVTIEVGDAADSDRIASVTGNVVLQNYYTGSSAPSSSLGSNGDLYLQS